MGGFIFGFLFFLIFVGNFVLLVAGGSIATTITAILIFAVICGVGCAGVS